MATIAYQSTGVPTHPYLILMIAWYWTAYKSIYEYYYCVYVCQSISNERLYLWSYVMRRVW